MVNEIGATRGDTKLTGYYVGFIVSYEITAIASFTYPESIRR